VNGLEAQSILVFSSRKVIFGPDVWGIAFVHPEAAQLPGVANAHPVSLLCLHLVRYKVLPRFYKGLAEPVPSGWMGVCVAGKGGKKETTVILENVLQDLLPGLPSAGRSSSLVYETDTFLEQDEVWRWVGRARKVGEDSISPG
jgi:hypothetical protein